MPFNVVLELGKHRLVANQAVAENMELVILIFLHKVQPLLTLGFVKMSINKREETPGPLEEICGIQSANASVGIRKLWVRALVLEINFVEVLQTAVVDDSLGGANSDSNPNGSGTLPIPPAAFTFFIATLIAELNWSSVINTPSLSRLTYDYIPRVTSKDQKRAGQTDRPFNITQPLTAGGAPPPAHKPAYPAPRTAP